MATVETMRIDHVRACSWYLLDSRYLYSGSVIVAISGFSDDFGENRRSVERPLKGCYCLNCLSVVWKPFLSIVHGFDTKKTHRIQNTSSHILCFGLLE